MLNATLTTSSRAASSSSTTEQADDWVTTLSGAQLNPRQPRPEDIDIEDIAHGLSNICRFGGQCRTFYSVAQHSVIVAQALPPQLQMQGLLHDAPEAYIGDMVRPLKALFPEYRRLESLVWRAVCDRFGLPVEMHHEVVIADNSALLAEKRDLCNAQAWKIQEQGYKALPGKIVPVSPHMAKFAFMQMFEQLNQVRMQ